MGVSLEGRVAIVTGAGRGLGRAYALDLARLGARVVVNDIGVSVHGEGPDDSLAAQVVSEIEASGGEAVANTDSVAEYDGGFNIVKAAMDTWGRVDAVVCNAGVLRDAAFHNMGEEDWDLVFATHVKGAYTVLRAAWPVFRQQSYGRVVLATSSAGFVGNFGQANYGAAKGALIGLMNVLKLEGHKYNVRVNCIAPVAATRMTEGLFKPGQDERMKPEYVAPVVSFLCSEECPDSGSIIEAGGGSYGRAAIVRNRQVKADAEAVDVDWVAANWEQITSLADAEPWWNLGRTLARHRAGDSS